MEFKSNEVSDVLFCRIFFQYLGSLQMPHTWKQGPSLSCINTCIKRIESEGREPIVVSLEIHSNSLKLLNTTGHTIRVFPFHTLVYAGASTLKPECMVVVTRSSLAEYSPQLDEAANKIMNISHAFMVQPNNSVIRYHGPAKAQRLMRSLEVLDYPQDALRVLKLFIRMFELCTKYEPNLKSPRPQYDNVTGAVILVDFRINNTTHDVHSSSSEHSPFMSLQHSSSDGSITDDVSFTVSNHSNKFDYIFDNLSTRSDTRLNGKVSANKTSSTSLDCISKYNTKHVKQGSYSSLHESSLHPTGSPRKNAPRKAFSESQPCLRKASTRVDLWMESLDSLLYDSVGISLFREFLITQFCVENLEFWIAIEKYKNLKNPIEIGLHKSAIFQKYIDDRAPTQVNLEERLRRDILSSMGTADTTLFNQAQKQVYHTLRYDCYPRFKTSTILASYVKENRYVDLKDSVNTESSAQASLSDIHSSCQSIEPCVSTSENEKVQRHMSNPLSFIRRSFNKRRNSVSKENTNGLSNQSSPEEFTFVRNNIPTDHREHNIYLHVPGMDKLCVKLKIEFTLREVLEPILEKLQLPSELYEYRQADTLNLISLDLNSIHFTGLNILLQQHTESFVLTTQLPSQPNQEYTLRTSNSKTILEIIQPILNIKGITKESISLHLSECNVPLQLELNSTVLNKQKVRLIGQDQFGTLKVKTGILTPTDSSPTRDAKQELLKTQYPKRKVNKIRTSLRNKKDKQTTKDMFSLIESVQGNRLNEQRSIREKSDCLISGKNYYPEKPPKNPTTSNTDFPNTNHDICPHTGEMHMPNFQESQRQQQQQHQQQYNHSVFDTKPHVPPKERAITDPPRYTPHKPTSRVPQNLSEAKFQSTNFAPNPRLNNNNHTNSYNTSDIKLLPTNAYYQQTYKQVPYHPQSLPVAPVYPKQQSLFYKGPQHFAQAAMSIQNSTHYNSSHLYAESTNETYRQQSSRGILTVPSPFDDCNLPSRMNFSQKLSPISTVHTQNASAVIHGYRHIPTNSEQKLNNLYQKTAHTPSYL